MLPPAGVHDREQRPALGLLESVETVRTREATLAKLLRSLLPLGLAFLQALTGVLEDHLQDLLARDCLEVEVLEVYPARVEAVDLGGQRLHVPVLRVNVLGGVQADHLREDLLDILPGVHLLAHQDIAPYGIDNLALLVEDVVVLEDPLPDLEVLALDLLLGAPHRARDHARLDRHVLLQTDPLDHALHPLPAETPQEIVLEREVEPRLTRVSLAPRTSA